MVVKTNEFEQTIAQINFTIDHKCNFMPTYRDYTEFCRKLSDTGVPTYTVKQAWNNLNALNKQFIIVKHDVEDNPKKALNICRIEHEYGIKSTYYVHSFFLDNPKNVKVFKEIIRLGHEIGYHFDVLDNNNGDFNRAIKEFEETLSHFARCGINIKTVCPHGNPLKNRVGYSSNKDFFLDDEIRYLFSDIVDVYITFPDLLDKDYLYITDAEYAYLYRDAKTTKTDATEKYFPLENRDEIINFIKGGHCMIISTHSHRYFCFGIINKIRIVLYQVSRQIAYLLYNVKWGRYLINRFYYLAKKI